MDSSKDELTPEGTDCKPLTDEEFEDRRHHLRHMGRDQLLPVRI